MLLIDGVRYHPHKFKEERELEEVIEEHAKDIFGEESVYFGKRKISSLSGVASIPDGYAITFWDTPRWYVVEVELSSHPVFEHIVSQINKFISGIKSDMTKRELIDYMDEEIRFQRVEHLVKGEVYKFLSKLIYSPPIILTIVDEKTRELEEAVANISAVTKILEFKTFEREGVGIAVHAHLFDPLFLPKPVAIAKPLSLVAAPIVELPTAGETTPQRQFALPLLEALIEMGGAGKVHDVLNWVYEKMKNRLKPKDLEKLKSGRIRWANYVEWERWRLISTGCLKRDSPRGVWEITDQGRKLYETLRMK